jgi:hypothetical protein
MTQRPHDMADLYLAPVALSVDAALADLADLSGDALAGEVALRTNGEPRTPDERRRAMLEAVTHLVDLHGWTVAWVDRGLELSHDGHRLVLGVPESVRAFVSV